jgi:hypothetical protein
MTFKAVTERRLLISDAMKDFEKKNDGSWAYIAGFYSSLIKDLAVDRPDDFQMVLATLKQYRK